MNIKTLGSAFEWKTYRNKAYTDHVYCGNMMTRVWTTIVDQIISKTLSKQIIYIEQCKQIIYTSIAHCASLTMPQRHLVSSSKQNKSIAFC